MLANIVLYSGFTSAGKFTFNSCTTKFVSDQEGNTDSDALATNITTDHYNLGGATYRGFNKGMYDGKIYEVIQYDSALSQSEIDQVTNYLTTKWNTL